jgi:hypothetical protein
VATPDPNVARWLQENQRPELPPDLIHRRRIWIPITLALLVGLGMAIGNAPRVRSAPEPSPDLQVRVMAATAERVPGQCDLRVADSRGDTGVLHGQSCQDVGATTTAYLNSRGTLQVTPPLKAAHGIIRDVFTGVIWFGIVLPFFLFLSWFLSRRILGRRHGRQEGSALLDVP